MKIIRTLLTKRPKLYYSDDVVATALGITPGKFETGTQWEYQSACTQLHYSTIAAIGESISLANRELFAKVGFESRYLAPRPLGGLNFATAAGTPQAVILPSCGCSSNHGYVDSC